MRYYNKYLADRIELERPYVSVLEKTAAVIASKLQSDCQFRLLEFIEDECYACLCIADKNGRFRIFDILCYTHSLGELFKKYSGNLIEKIELSYYYNGNIIENDHYYEQHYPELRHFNSDLQSAIEPLQLRSIDGIETYIAGVYSEHVSVLYAIQNLIGKVHIEKVSENADLKSKILFSQDLINKRVHVSQYGTTVMDIIRSKGIDVFVPLDAKSLSSSFIDEIRWEQLLTPKASRCQVGNVECVYLRIGFEIDSFNNLICRIDDNTGKNRKVLIDAPFGNKPVLGADYISSEGNRTVEGINSPAEVLTQIAEQTESVELYPTSAPIQKVEQTQSRKTQAEIEHSQGIAQNVKHNIEPNEVNVPHTAASTPSISHDLRPKTFDVLDGDVYSYYDLFGDYLIGADEVIIQDPYIRLHYQFENLKDLIATFLRVSKENNTPKLKKVHLLTKLPNKGYTAGDTVVTVEEAIRQNKENFEKLAIELRDKKGIIFTYDVNFRDHDRCVLPNNGWFIGLGPGLDIFNKATDRYEDKTCRKAHITIDRIENRLNARESTIRKKRRIK